MIAHPGLVLLRAVGLFPAEARKQPRTHLGCVQPYSSRATRSSALQAVRDFSVALAADTALPAHTSGIDLPPSLAISPALSLALTFLEVVMMRL